MRKAVRYTKISSNGKVIAELHDGYINTYMNYKLDVPVTYFVYKNSKISSWYAVDIATGMAIVKAERRKDLMSLDDETVARLYALKHTEFYKEMVHEFTLLTYEAREK